jgi:hypothetical protein
VQAVPEEVVCLLSHLQRLLLRAVAEDHEVISVPRVDKIRQIRFRPLYF